VLDAVATASGLSTVAFSTSKFHYLPLGKRRATEGPCRVPVLRAPLRHPELEPLLECYAADWACAAGRR